MRLALSVSTETAMRRRWEHSDILISTYEQSQDVKSRAEAPSLLYAPNRFALQLNVNLDVRYFIDM